MKSGFFMIHWGKKSPKLLKYTLNMHYLIMFLKNEYFIKRNSIFYYFSKLWVFLISVLFIYYIT